MIRPQSTADPDRANPWLEQLPREPFILFVGALQPHKGLRPLLEAHAGLVAAPPLVVVGTRWPNSPTSWPPGVTALENVPNDVVRRIWDRALFGVAPSLVPETFGDVVLEAMSSGRPMIASAIGGPLDSIEDQRTGLLVAPGDVRALRDAMRALVDNPQLRERLGANGRARVVELFSTDAVVPRFEALYESILGRIPADRRGGAGVHAERSTVPRRH
jgi:glycosyltransferase involved in cell wall biosynthesis